MIKYRVYHEIQIFPGTWATRPLDLRDRTRSGAIIRAASLRNGEVRKKGSLRVEWSSQDRESRLRAINAY